MLAVHHQAAGVLTIDVIAPEDLPAIIAGAFAGRARLRALLVAIEHALDGIRRAPPDTPMLCATCPAPILPGGSYWMAVAAPHRDDADRCLALAVCSHCAPDRTAADRQAHVALRNIWPAARPITVHHAVGRA